MMDDVLFKLVSVLTPADVAQIKGCGLGSQVHDELIPKLEETVDLWERAGIVSGGGAQRARLKLNELKGGYQSNNIVTLKDKKA